MLRKCVVREEAEKLEEKGRKGEVRSGVKVRKRILQSPIAFTQCFYAMFLLHQAKGDPFLKTK
jgi:hypothetical protein